MHASGFISVEDKLLQLGKVCKKKKQMIALEILHRSNSLKFDLRSTVTTADVSKGQ